MPKKVLIVNNGTKYVGDLTNRVIDYCDNKAQVDTFHIRDVKSKTNLSEYDVIILSGSKNQSHKGTAHKHIIDRMRDDACILGICHGHQSLAYLYGSTVENLGKYQSGYQEIDVKEDNGIIGAKGKIRIYKKHKYAVTRLGPDLETIAESEVRDAQGNSIKIIEAFKHKSRNIYGIQGHPERGGQGERILYNLLDLALQSGDGQKTPP